MKRRALTWAVALTGFCAAGAAAQDAARSTASTWTSATSAALSHAKSRSISPENFTGEKGKGGMATEGTGAHAARELGPGLEDLALRADRCRGDLHARRDRGAGRHPADLDDADRQLALLHPALLLGRRDDSVGRGAGRRLLRQRLGPLRAGELAAGHGQPRQRVQLLLGDAVPQVARGSRWRTSIDDEPHEALLPGQLHAHRRARGRRLLPRAVPAHQPGPVQAGLHHASTASRARATTSAPTWRGGRTATAGGARARSSSSWTATEVPDHRRHRHRGLLRGSYKFANPKTQHYLPFTTPYAGMPQVIRPTALPVTSCASASTAGTSWTRCASSRTSR